MNKSLLLHFTIRNLIAAMATVSSVGAAWAAGPSMSEARETYARERAACLSGNSSEPRETCLKEAGAALAEARHGKAPDPDQASLTANALRRCEQVPVADRYACQQMALGGGAVSGSVEGGGVLKEYVTTIPAD